MLTRIKNGIFGIVALGVLAAAALYFFDPSSRGGGNDDHEMVVVKVGWTPVNRVHVIMITILVTGEPPAQETARNSPFVETVPVPRGSAITVRATQPVRDLGLQCSITVRGNMTGPIQATPTIGGASACAATVTA